ncbi:MAG: hypothetical protein AAGG51_29500 [Cyanobacteria bacterium P01_G01_bin.54]
MQYALTCLLAKPETISQLTQTFQALSNQSQTTLIFNAPTTGVVGNVEGDQTINPPQNP